MSRKALVIIDLQRGIGTSENKLYNINNVIEGVNGRIKQFRNMDGPILFIQHTDEDLRIGTNEWTLFPQLEAISEDIYIRKSHANSFYRTELDNILKKLDIDAIEFCGAQTELCVDTTIRFAHGLGYKCYMKKGLSTTLNGGMFSAQDIIRYHENIWNNRFLDFI